MGKIILLDEQTCNQIAAGEVVESPASIVKEMVENAVDAGATQIQVEIKNGGVKLIRISDNGSGMERDDVELAFERHATSKMKRIDDLETIASMGFRGEALASIASVSRVEMQTKTIGESYGTKAVLEGGQLLLVEPTGCPVGTTFIVRDLFYNTPARYKFLKKDTTEAAHVTDIIERLALAHPDVSIQLISNGTDILRTPGNGDLASAIYSIYGKEVANAILPVSYSFEGMMVSGYVGKPSISRGNRTRQTFLMNGRYIQNRSITAALDEAYKTLLMTRQFAFAVIVLTIPAFCVDVNVHPAKLEVRFSDDKSVFSAVHGSVKNALIEGSYNGMMVPTEHLGEKSGNLNQYDTSKIQETRIQSEPLIQKERSVQGQFIPSMESLPDNVMHQELVSNANAGVQPTSNPSLRMNEQKTCADISIFNTSSEGITSNAPFAIMKLMEETDPNEYTNDHNHDNQANVKIQERIDDFKSIKTRHPVFNQMKIIGQVLDTYIVLQYNEEMILIDQHAAHERIRFEELKNNMEKGEATSQQLLQPILVHLNAIEYETAKLSMSDLNLIGFEMEEFGNGTIIIRGIPTAFDGGLIEAEISSILTEQSAESIRKQSGISDERLHSISCKGAIKANQAMGFQEIRALLDRLSRLENPYSCVHGRPTLVRFPKMEIEKRFKRIV